MSVAIAFLAVGPFGSGSRSLQAQTVVEQVTSDVRDAGKDIVAVWISPVTGQRKGWLIAAGTIGAAAALSIFDDEIDRWAVRNEASSAFKPIEELRRGGVLFGGSKIVPVAAAGYVFGVATNNQSIRDGMFGCVASYASASLSRTQVVYRIVGRVRPDSVRNRDATSPASPPAQSGDQYNFLFPGSTKNWGEHSLPGGHVQNILACVSFLNHRFDMGYAEPIFYAIAGGVGVGRILDRGHWASDQVIGMVVGFAVGKHIATRSSRRLAAAKGTAGSSASSAASFSIVPTRDGVNMGWTRVF